MIIRLTQKLKAKIKTGKLVELPLDENPYADWTCHLFIALRTQYILLTNTPSLYSCVMYGRGITSESTFIARARDTIRDFTADDGQQLIYRKFIAPAIQNASFAKALNRSVTGSINDFVFATKLDLMNDMDPNEIGYRLNITPMSMLMGPDGNKYGCPRDVFVNLLERTTNE